MLWNLILITFSLIPSSSVTEHWLHQRLVLYVEADFGELVPGLVYELAWFQITVQQIAGGHGPLNIVI